MACSSQDSAEWKCQLCLLSLPLSVTRRVYRDSHTHVHGLEQVQTHTATSKGAATRYRVITEQNHVTVVSAPPPFHYRRFICVSTLHPCSLPQLLLFAGPAVARKLKTGPAPRVEMSGNTGRRLAHPLVPTAEERLACLVSHYSWRPMIYKRVLLEPGLSIKVSPPFYRSDQDILHVDKATGVSQLRESCTRTKCD